MKTRMPRVLIWKTSCGRDTRSCHLLTLRVLQMRHFEPELCFLNWLEMLLTYIDIASNLFVDIVQFSSWFVVTWHSFGSCGCTYLWMGFLSISFLSLPLSILKSRSSGVMAIMLWAVGEMPFHLNSQGVVLPGSGYTRISIWIPYVHLCVWDWIIWQVLSKLLGMGSKRTTNK